MEQVRRVAAAVIVAVMMASGIPLGTASLQAASKKGGDGQAAMCAYLLSVITYPYVSPAIQAYAISLYISEGCTSAP